jgi:bacterioferritin-associated ferredoxin
VVSFTARPLYPQVKYCQYPLDRRLGGPQSWSGRGGEEKNTHLPPGLEPSIIQPIAQRFTTELSQLQAFTVGLITVCAQCRREASCLLSQKLASSFITWNDVFLTAVTPAVMVLHTRVFPEVSGLAAWSENCKWYSSLPLDAMQLYRYFVSQCSEFSRHNPLCYFSTSVVYFVIGSVRKLLVTLSCSSILYLVVHPQCCSSCPQVVLDYRYSLQGCQLSSEMIPICFHSISLFYLTET